MRDYKIYVHTTPNGKRYVGVTHQSVNRRWRQGKGYKPCVYFDKAIKKYGWDNIIHQVLISGLTKEQAEVLERQFIERWRTNDKRYGYNSRLGGNANSKLSEDAIAKIKMAKAGKVPKGKDSPNYGKHPNALTRERMRKAKLGLYDGAKNPSARKVAMIGKDGKLVRTFDTMQEASRFCGRTSTSSICEVCRGKQATAYGYVWKYVTEDSIK